MIVTLDVVLDVLWVAVKRRHVGVPARQAGAKLRLLLCLFNCAVFRDTFDRVVSGLDPTAEKDVALMRKLAKERMELLPLPGFQRAFGDALPEKIKASPDQLAVLAESQAMKVCYLAEKAARTARLQKRAGDSVTAPAPRKTSKRVRVTQRRSAAFRCRLSGKSPSQRAGSERGREPTEQRAR